MEKLKNKIVSNLHLDMKHLFGKESYTSKGKRELLLTKYFLNCTEKVHALK